MRFVRASVRRKGTCGCGKVNGGVPFGQSQATIGHGGGGAGMGMGAGTAKPLVKWGNDCDEVVLYVMLKSPKEERKSPNTS